MARPPASTPPGRETLITVARRLFLERGFASVSMQQIAEEAGMTKGAPYYHFRNKQDLFITVSIEIFADLMTTADAAFETEGSFRDQLEYAIVTIVRSISGDFSRWYTDMISMQDSCALDSAIQGAFDTSSLPAMIQPRFDAAHAAGSFTRVPPDVAAYTWFLMLKAAIDYDSMEKTAKSDAHRPLEQVTHDLMDIFFHGIA